MASSHTQPGPQLTPSGRAPRGSACLNCRRRKLRCDGGRPICTQCIRTHREADCEYTDGTNLSLTQILEENIATLEARIYELEHPELVSPPVILYNPVESPMSTPTGPPGAASSSIGIQSAAPLNISAPIPTQLSGAQVPLLYNEPGVQPAPEIMPMVIEFFLLHSSQVGFFLHKPRFVHLIRQQDPQSRNSRVSSALVNAVYLWGVRFSGDAGLLQHEQSFLSRAVQALSDDLANVQAHNVTFLIQAEVLLATYFLAQGRFLEGRYHCSAAVALALSCKLNRIRSANSPALRAEWVHTTSFDIPAPADAVEEGERINAFWMVYVLHKSWSVGLGSPSQINDENGAQIDTPWPLDVEQYEQDGLSGNFRSSRTMQMFLNNTAPYGAVHGTSTVALRVQAVALFDRATHLASIWSPTMSNIERFWTDVVAFDTVVNQFISSLLPLEAAGDADTTRYLLLTHTFAWASLIQIYSPFRGMEGLSQAQDLTAARAVVVALDKVNLFDFVQIDPIFSILWTAVCRVLIGELWRMHLLSYSGLLLEWLAYAHAGAARLRDLHTSERQLNAALQQVLTAMIAFSEKSILMANQVEKVRQEMTAIGLQ
ncbi:hypothetical protein OBBRIDRAFT_779891 [Obba rivulosa]|uniref:Zn(2)-C6 fungal-type domain-containing protein n=1 Tax=Obba rivulosa TaxID=1052685 RepID=A0A8E2AXR4_9APHY|nr:hypothetical protein OBBRIDRAFT_779891 [Obba rivulosa]